MRPAISTTHDGVPTAVAGRQRGFHSSTRFFWTVRDGSYGDERWIEVKPPDGTITNDWELRDDDGEWRPWRHTTMTRVGETDGGQA
jgi:hypothetical protein